MDLDTRWLFVASIPILAAIMYSGILSKLKIGGFEIESGIKMEVSPSKKDLSTSDTKKLELTGKEKGTVIPADYIYINHTSFLRKDKQEEFQARTHVYDYPHYDIRVIIDSYYKGAIDRIAYVVYYLHEAYPNPIQTRYDKKDHFCLKEVANGEYVLIAKVFLKDLDTPIILERYITLWETGPQII